MSLIRHRVLIPPRVRAVVNRQFDSRDPLYVGSEDKVFFASIDAITEDIPRSGPCREGVIHTVEVQVRVSLPFEDPGKLSTYATHSTYREPVTVTARDVFASQSVQSALAATIGSYIQGQGFFDLLNPDTIKQGLAAPF